MCVCAWNKWGLLTVLYTHRHKISKGHSTLEESEVGEEGDRSRSSHLWAFLNLKLLVATGTKND